MTTIVHIWRILSFRPKLLGFRLKHGSTTTIALGTPIKFHGKSGQPTWILDPGPNGLMIGEFSTFTFPFFILINEPVLSIWPLFPFIAIELLVYPSFSYLTLIMFRELLMIFCYLIFIQWIFNYNRITPWISLESLSVDYGWADKENFKMKYLGRFVKKWLDPTIWTRTQPNFQVWAGKFGFGKFGFGSNSRQPAWPEFPFGSGSDMTNSSDSVGFRSYQIWVDPSKLVFHIIFFW